MASSGGPLISGYNSIVGKQILADVWSTLHNAYIYIYVYMLYVSIYIFINIVCIVYNIYIHLVYKVLEETPDPPHRPLSRKSRAGLPSAGMQIEPVAAPNLAHHLRSAVTSAYPLKLQALGKLIFYRHIAHVTQKVEKLCF